MHVGMFLVSPPYHCPKTLATGVISREMLFRIFYIGAPVSEATSFCIGEALPVTTIRLLVTLVLIWRLPHYNIGSLRARCPVCSFSTVVFFDGKWVSETAWKLFELRAARVLKPGASEQKQCRAQKRALGTDRIQMKGQLLSHFPEFGYLLW